MRAEVAPTDRRPDGQTSNVVSIVADQRETRSWRRPRPQAYADAFVDWRKERMQAQIDDGHRGGRGARCAELRRAPPRSRPTTSILQQRLRDLQILDATATGNFRVLVPATVPEAPIAPKPLRSAILGFGVGLFAGIGLAFLLEQFDTRVRRPDEVAARAAPAGARRASRASRASS